MVFHQNRVKASEIRPGSSSQGLTGGDTVQEGMTRLVVSTPFQALYPEGVVDFFLGLLWAHLHDIRVIDRWAYSITRRRPMSDTRETHRQLMG